MTRAETVSSPPPPGAGRFNDLSYPDVTVVGAAAQTPNLRARATGSIITGGTLQNLGGLVTSTSLYYQGVMSATMNNTGLAGAGGCISWLNVANIPIRTSLPAGAFWPLDDDNNVFRIVWISCIAALTGITNDDYGLQLINANSASAGIKRTPANGIGFQFTGTGISLRTNNGGGFVDTVLATNGVGGYSNQDYHSYEFRILNALPTQPATLKIVIDDIVLLTIPFVGGTPSLPLVTGSTAVTFFPALWINSPAVPNSAMVTHFLGIQNAPTELNTL